MGREDFPYWPFDISPLRLLLLALYKDKPVWSTARNTGFIGNHSLCLAGVSPLRSGTVSVSELLSSAQSCSAEEVMLVFNNFHMAYSPGIAIAQPPCDFGQQSGLLWTGRET